MRAAASKGTQRPSVTGSDPKPVSSTNANALHVAYVVALVTGIVDTRAQLLVALAAYAAYLVNATQFVLKLRAARMQERSGVLSASGSAA